MVPILDGNPDVGAYVRNGLGDLICLRHLVISRTVSYLKMFLKKHLFSFTRAQKYSVLPSNLSTMGCTVYTVQKIDT